MAAMTESTRAVLALILRTASGLSLNPVNTRNEPENKAEVKITLEMHWNEYHTRTLMPLGRIITSPTYPACGYFNPTNPII